MQLKEGERDSMLVKVQLIRSIRPSSGGAGGKPAYLGISFFFTDQLLTWRNTNLPTISELTIVCLCMRK